MYEQSIMQIELEKMNTCAGGLRSVTVVSRGSVTNSQGICGCISLIVTLQFI